MTAIGYFIALIVESIVCLILSHHCKHNNRDHMCELNHFCVSHHHQRLGVGKALLSLAMLYVFDYLPRSRVGGEMTRQVDLSVVKELACAR